MERQLRLDFVDQYDGLCAGRTLVQPRTDSNHNGIPDAYQYQNFGALVSASADPDHDGQSNLEEYLAGTDPNNAGDFLRITSIRRSFGTITVLAGSSIPTVIIMLRSGRR